jgi:hypothetical protein
MQVALVVIVYLATYLVTWGITSGLAAVSPGRLRFAFADPLGVQLHHRFRARHAAARCAEELRKHNIMTRQYQINYLLNRISGAAST